MYAFPTFAGQAVEGEVFGAPTITSARPSPFISPTSKPVPHPLVNPLSALNTMEAASPEKTGPLSTSTLATSAPVATTRSLAGAASTLAAATWLFATVKVIGAGGDDEKIEPG